MNPLTDLKTYPLKDYPPHSDAEGPLKAEDIIITHRYLNDTSSRAGQLFEKHQLKMRKKHLTEN